VQHGSVESAAQRADRLAEALTGQTLGGRYRVERRVGQGGMASVHLARDLETDGEVAVKVLLTELIGDPESAQRMQREAAIAMRLDHPNV
jgi:serine/threonine-protein kinase